VGALGSRPDAGQSGAVSLTVLNKYPYFNSPTLNRLPIMQNQIAAYLPSPNPVVVIVYQKEPYQYVGVFVNQTRQQAEERFKQNYPLEGEETYEVNEYEDVESYSVTDDGRLVVNGSYT
jgi:hypothetical protein